MCQTMAWYLMSCVIGNSCIRQEHESILPCCMQSRDVNGSIDPHVHVHSHKYGLCTERAHPVLLQRGTMENFIKESENGVDFAAVSSSSKTVKANRLQVHALACNIFSIVSSM